MSGYVISDVYFPRVYPDRKVVINGSFRASSTGQFYGSVSRRKIHFILRLPRFSKEANHTCKVGIGKAENTQFDVFLCFLSPDSLGLYGMFGSMEAL